MATRCSTGMASGIAGALVLGLLVLWGSGCATPGGGGGGGPAAENENAETNENTGDGEANENAADGEANENAGPTEPAPELFAASTQCASCHNGLTDAEGNDVSIEASWKSTIMANATRDPYYQAKVSSEVEHNPALQEIIEDKCVTCHAPMARTQAVADGSTGALLGEGFLSAENDLHEWALDSVSCTACHQIQDEALGEAESFGGEYRIDTTTEKPDRLTYGPFDDQQGDVMQGATGYVPVQGRQVSDAGLCATCHTVITPFVDAEGNVAGEFPEQVPYLEWRHGEFGDGVGEDQTCQDCHVPDAEGSVAISSIPPRLEARNPFGRHHFVGGNAFMLTMLQEGEEELEVAAAQADFDATVTRTLSQLQENAAGLTIERAELDGDTLAVDLRIENLAGHRLPTGFPSRRVWLQFTVTDGAGETVFESGAPQADGRVAGNDADADITALEPHYDAITAEDQVQIYESVMQDTDGQVTYILLRGATYAKDNRVPPRGFDKDTAEADFAVYGAAADDDDFVGGSDEIEYRINVAEAEGPFTVTARLLYQSVAYPFVESLQETDTPLVQRFLDYYDEADKTPIVMATAEQTVP